jgi:hypothetical protein
VDFELPPPAATASACASCPRTRSGGRRSSSSWSSTSGWRASTSWAGATCPSTATTSATRPRARARTSASSSSRPARHRGRPDGLRAQALRHPADRRARHGPGLLRPSFSSRTLVYKGMLISHQLRRYFPDLQDPRSRRAWRWCTRGSPRTRSRAGSSATPTA